MKELFSLWSDIAEQFTHSDKLVLLLDFDGTLTPIVRRPELVVLNESTRKLLRNLAELPSLVVSVISGREISDLIKLVDVDNLLYAGNHGLQVDGPGLKYSYPISAEIKTELVLVRQVLTKSLSNIPGVIVEDKGLTVSLHYRTVAPSKREDVRLIFERVTGGLAAMGHLRVSEGKMVFEIKPAVAWDKGKAVQMILRHLSADSGKQRALLPLYAGDDSTDEDAFRIVNRNRDGITVFVGKQDAVTEARYYVNSYREIVRLLKMILSLLKGSK